MESKSKRRIVESTKGKPVDEKRQKTSAPDKSNTKYATANPAEEQETHLHNLKHSDPVLQLHLPPPQNGKSASLAPAIALSPNLLETILIHYHQHPSPPLASGKKPFTFVPMIKIEQTI